MKTSFTAKIAIRSLLIGLSAFAVLRLLAWFSAQNGFGDEPDSRIFGGLALIAAVLMVVALALQIREMLNALREAARSSDRKFRDLLRDVDAIVWDADPATLQFRFVSERAQEILGYPVEQWLKEPDFWSRHLHAEDREWVLASCHKTADTGGDTKLEYRMIAADGRVVWLRDNARLVLSGKGPALLRGVMVDITETKQAQQALQKSEATNRALLGAIPDLMLRIRGDGTYLNCKAPREAAFGLDAASMIGSNVIKVLPPEVAVDTMFLIGQALDTGETQVHEFRLPPHDVPRDFEARIVPSGEDEVLALIRDITSRKRAEEAVRAAEAELRRVLSSVSDCIWTAEVDSDGQVRLLYISPVIAKISGRPPEYYTGPEQWYAHAHPEDSERFEKFVRQTAARPGGSGRIEYRVVWPDGSIRWVRTAATASRLDEQRVRVDGVDADITASKQADEARRQASEALEAVIQASPLAIFALDLDGRIRSWNPAAECIFGWAAREVLDISMPLPGAPAPEIFHALIERGRRGEVMNGVEVTQQRKDGSLVEVAIWTALLRDEAGAPSGFMTVAADTSQRRQLEEQLRQSQKMEAVGRLAGGVAHDFNNLLTVITGYGYMLLDDLQQEGSEPLRSNVEQILCAVDKASALTNQLLAFSRRQIARPKPIDLTVLVANMDRMLRRVIGEHIELVAELSAGLGIVRADPGQIEQVLMNLIVNARDAMPGGGRITVRTENVEFDREATAVPFGAPLGRCVKLSVTDTGHGMDEATRARLFEPFFTTKDPGKGTGLGMSLVYGIVKQAGGEIEVASAMGDGTSIAICLPRIEEAAEQRSEAPAPSKAECGSETILLVEDEDDVRKLVVDVLTQRGYSVLETSRPEEAVHICQAHPKEIHLLLTDVVMPGMNGRELAERLAWMRPDMKTVYMSGYTQDAKISGGLEALFLRKPFTPSVLAKKIRQVLDEAGEIEPLPQGPGPRSGSV